MDCRHFDKGWKGLGWCICDRHKWKYKLEGSLMLCVQDGSDLLGMPESQGAQVQWLDRPLWLRGIREETD